MEHNQGHRVGGRQRPWLQAYGMPFAFLMRFSTYRHSENVSHQVLCTHIRCAHVLYTCSLFGPDPQALNFTEAESHALYSGAKALGVSPFACFTYAAHRACTEVLHQPFRVIAQQANLQPRHFPIATSSVRPTGWPCAVGSLLDDWLECLDARVGEEYSLE